MRILLSPTKQMDFSREIPSYHSQTIPRYSPEAEILAGILRKLDTGSIGTLMGVRSEIAADTARCFQNFGASGSAIRPALFAYSGTVFRHLDPLSLNKSQQVYAASCLCILSGLYGCLRAFDGIQSYRLEMKTPLSGSIGKNLYEFLREKITGALSEERSPLLNLCSGEYARAVDWKQLDRPVYTVQFREKSAGKYRTVGMYSKMARGLLAGKIIRRQIENIEDIKNWQIGGYQFDEELSSDREWVFSGNWSRL